MSPISDRLLIKMMSKKCIALLLFAMYHFMSTNAVKDLVLLGGSCTVSSINPYTISNTYQSTSMEGTCSNLISCRKNSGVALGRCPGGKVCCGYVRTCDQRTSQNNTYFVNPPNLSTYSNGSNSCVLTVYKAFPFRICQLRLDFLDFDINRPSNGTCDTDRLIISGQNSNSIVPVICGRNTGQHMYVDVDNVQGPFQVRVMTAGPGYRRWNIRISQIECNNPSRAPANCLQYFTGPRGTIMSFNYESSIIAPFGTTTVAPLNTYTDASYLNGMDYSMCFRKEAGFCSQTYRPDNYTRIPFEITNLQPDGVAEISPLAEANAGQVKCPNDYLQLGGIRFCGSYINVNSIQGNIRANAPYTDRTRGPFIARFVSDSHSVRRGFQVIYQQNPCGLQLPPDSISSTSGG